MDVNYFVVGGTDKNADKIYVDGSPSINGKSMFCIVCKYKSKLKQSITEFVANDEKFTSNEMEYKAIIYGLEFILNNKIKNSVLMHDSLLVINQLRGTWRVKAKNLIPYWKTANKLLKEVYKKYQCEIKWVSRNDNLAGIELDNKKR